NTPYQSGNSSSEIQQLKVKLKTLGFADHWKVPNNDYGPETVDVVKGFQSYYRLVVNGIIDDVTEDKINSILNSPFQLGNCSLEIKEIKTDLMLLGFANHWYTPNDNYGPETVEVVKKFQKTHNLPVSGIVEESTYSLIKTLQNQRIYT